MSTSLTRDSVQEGLLLAMARHRRHNVYACYQCGKCTAACPFSFSPQRVMRHLQLGQIEQALAMETTWDCASCLTCSRVCPKDADPAGVMRDLKSVRFGPLTGEDVADDDLAARQGLTDLAAARHRRHGHALRGYFFANIHDVSRRGSRLAPVSNWMTRLPGTRLFAHHVLGVHKERSLPAFVRPSFPEWFDRRQPSSDGHRGPVFLFHDTFMDYDAPRIGTSATELLELAGYRVVLANNLCCGRPMISKGYVEQARELARANVERLFEQVTDGAAIVGCEPSCLLTLREEYPRLLAGSDLEAKADAVASRARLLDEFLTEDLRAADNALGFEIDPGNKVLFHGHCQQKAEADARLSLELLRRAGYDAEMVAAPCCGMAGAFGFEREHYEASKAAFQRALGPALEAHPEAQIVVMGISCRKQIEHFTGRRVVHLAEALRVAAVPVSACAASPTSR
jgi:Fe-S oxidoreductase